MYLWVGILLVSLGVGWIGYITSLKIHRSHQFCEYYSDIPFYLGGAKGIAELKSYKDPTTVGVPWMTLYPPAHSLFLAGFVGGEGTIDDQLDAAAIGMAGLQALAACLAFFGLIRTGVNPVVAAVASLMVSTSPQWMMLTTKFMSEPLFAVISFIVAWQFLNLPKTPTLGYGMLMGMLGAGLFLTRTAGIPFAFVIGLWSLYQLHRSRNWAWLLPGLVLGGATAGWILFARQGHSYVNYMAGNYDRAGGLLAFLPSIGQRVLELLALEDLSEAYVTGSYNWLKTRPTPFSWLVPAFGLLLLTLCVIGVRARRCAADSWSILALGLYSLQIAVWPFPLGARCAIPLLPWVVVYGWAGIGALRLPDRILRYRLPAVVGVLGAAVLVNLLVASSMARQAMRESSIVEFDEAIRWLAQNSSPSQSIGSGLDVPRVQISSKLGRPLVLWTPTSIPRDASNHDATASGPAHQYPDWYLHSSKSVPLPSAMLAKFDLVQAYGKWAIFRLRTQ